jgi:hypothetical protein
MRAALIMEQRGPLPICIFIGQLRPQQHTGAPPVLLIQLSSGSVSKSTSNVRRGLRMAAGQKSILLEPPGPAR